MVNQSKSRLVPCTLCSGDYHYGAGALINSLHASGFRGTFCVGCVPPFPPWSVSAKTKGDFTILTIDDDFQVIFIPWLTERNLSMEKPGFMSYVLERAAPDSDGVLFFDADIVVHGPWRFFENWVQQGVALCLDACYPLVPGGHPWRSDWRELAAKAGFNNIRELEYYVNSGYVGILRNQSHLLQCWNDLIQFYLGAQTVRPKTVKFAERDQAIVSDQDLLNVALMATSAPLSMIGKEGMDFVPAGYTMAHAIEPKKPWQKSFLKSAIKGSQASTAEKAYWRYAEGPIRLFSRSYIARKRIAIKIASAIGRFYGRS